MIIKHISILNLDNAGKIKSSISKRYSMRVYFAGSPDQTWKNSFSGQWRKLLFYKKKKLDFCYNEIRIFLDNGDDIQKYVDSIKSLVEKTNKAVALERKRQRNEYKRKLKKSNTCTSKTYKVI